MPSIAITAKPSQNYPFNTMRFVCFTTHFKHDPQIKIASVPQQVLILTPTTQNGSIKFDSTQSRVIGTPNIHMYPVNSQLVYLDQLSSLLKQIKNLHSMQ
jgi:hypothetical protein